MNQSVKIVFWNIHRKAENIPLILQYARENRVDVVALCETPNEYQYDHADYTRFEGVKYENNGLVVFARKYIRMFCSGEKKRFSVYRMESPLACSFAVVHLNSKRTPNAEDYRTIDIQLIKEKLLIAEKKYEDKKSFVVGDLNENVFEEHLIRSHGFNVRYFKCMMKKGTDKKRDIEEDLFYSPLLQEYRDRSEEQLGKGTYYYEDDPIGWLCYDQVLMKKQVMDLYKPDSFRILHSLSPSISLVANNKPRLEYSDHLPIQFELCYKEDQHE